jgi:hypothetical protein
VTNKVRDVAAGLGESNPMSFVRACGRRKRTNFCGIFRSQIWQAKLDAKLRSVLDSAVRNLGLKIGEVSDEGAGKYWQKEKVKGKEAAPWLP